MCRRRGRLGYIFFLFFFSPRDFFLRVHFLNVVRFVYGRADTFIDRAGRRFLGHHLRAAFVQFHHIKVGQDDVQHRPRDKKEPNENKTLRFWRTPRKMG